MLLFKAHKNPLFAFAVVWSPSHSGNSIRGALENDLHMPLS